MFCKPLLQFTTKLNYPLLPWPLNYPLLPWPLLCRAPPQISKIHSQSSILNRKSTEINTDRLRPKMAAIATTDLGDANEALLETGDLRALQPIFNSYGLRKSFHGRIVTVKVFEDNVLVKKMLESSPAHGAGSVMVVDGGGSLRCALVGGNLGQLACANGWGGIVVNGCIRDVDEINACDIGVRALATHPLKSKKRGAGETRRPVYVAGTLIRDGEWLYADGDGVLVSKNPLDLAE